MRDPVDPHEAPAANAGPPTAARGLTRSLREERHYECRVEGRLPRDLSGRLFRNGPGIFERAGFRKHCILDGDGMIQELRIGDGKAVYRNRFVRTPKFVAEEAAGRFLYPSWTTPAPGGWAANLGLPRIRPSASVNIVHRNGALYALEDVSWPYLIAESDLSTLGETRFGLDGAMFHAHPKIDGRTGHWVHFGMLPGRPYLLHLTELDAEDRVVRHRRIRRDDPFYIHDFFVTERYVVFNIMPVTLPGLFSLIFGTRSFAGNMKWRPERGSRLLIFRRDGSDDDMPVEIEVASVWMWHSVNAWNEGDVVIADFVGYDDPDHFLGPDPASFAIMEGRMVPVKNPGKLRRFRIDVGAGRATTEILHPGNMEFPQVHPSVSCARYRRAFFAASSRNAGDGYFGFDSVLRFDVDTGTSDAFAFEADCHVSEPSFAPAPSAAADDHAGWVLVLVYDGKSDRSFVAVLDARRLADGPLARIHLDHHTPIALHGCWVPGPG